ncbi:bifunctional diaminohydroxyphosphoribosylaminopyrimidine deaminase/5-amino-6-(5-phosphoribosylamino)uracil reductase RibD [Phenylobacterium sp.]|uniref:bifunctional diaminohydroxyphosphoribosylaminopyrimidine deaminase/5-amino-6-(5-phosphoribosylamino)uracil reductase RibD n=1 Tax=Phenylobacterium sp. TaxID=1871053 RepID=UPI002F935E12
MSEAHRQTAEDEALMRRALELARTRLGLTGENPAVGCLIVQGGQVVAEAVTAPGGRPHAEEQALEAAGASARGATAYVTLEPCGARSSGAASCSERLAAAGIARVVIGCEDASILASGLGTQRLKDAGVAITLDVLRTEASALYAGYRPRTR